jgi:hypothetical protein
VAGLMGRKDRRVLGWKKGKLPFLTKIETRRRDIGIAIKAGCQMIG